MSSLDVAGYLARLGVADPGPPSVDGLRRLHRAHVERIAYQTVEIHLGRPTTVDPYESAGRIVRAGRGGYCYHLNGAFGALLSELGYRVRWHRGGAQPRAGDAAPGADGTHLALTVHGLADPASPAGAWLVDVGLGDGPHEPLPLAPGGYRQGPFRYRLRRSPVVADGWRFEHDPAGSFRALDFATAPARPVDVADRHHMLSTSPDSGFVRTFTAQRRDATGADVLRGCLLTRVGTDAYRRQLDTAGDWHAVLVDVFNIGLADVPAEQRRALWQRVRDSHLRWAAGRDAAEVGA